MIYTVFPKDESLMPQDFATRQEAEAYIKDMDIDADVEETDGEVI